MQNTSFINGTGMVGGREIPFAQVNVQGRVRMYIPASFEEDSNLAYRYSYFSDKGKSPLGIALKYSPISSSEARDKIVANYLGRRADCELTAGEGGLLISYREAVHAGESISVYSLRFSVELDGGVLFGCFNASNKYAADWKPAVIRMLESIELL